MTTAQENTQSPQKAAIDRGVLDAYDAEGYLLPNGTKDNTKVRERIVEVLAQNKVLNWDEREDKATTRGALIRAVFPGLVGPDDFSEAEDPQLALAIWSVIDSSVWSECRYSASGPIQRLVGLRCGNGYALVRTSIGDDRIGAAYITADRECIVRDVLAKENAALQRMIDRMADLREMLIMRQPENGPRYAREFDRKVKAVAASAHDRLQLAIEASKPDNGDEPGDEPGDED